MFKIEFETDNDVFGDSLAEQQGECARILMDIAKSMMRFGLTCGSVSDVNGNKIGSWSLE